MKKQGIIFITSIFLATIILVNGCSSKHAFKKVGAANELKVEGTSAQIARGEYLSNHVTVCIDCHSKRDWTKFSGPLVAGTEGMGGDVFDEKAGLPGKYYASNITPQGISRYSDGELFRVITTGLNKENKPIFPIMPYFNYGKMDPDDIKCIIAYIRTLKPIKNDVPLSKSNFPVNYIINTLPRKANFTKIPDQTDLVKYGEYMTNAAGCVDCHTNKKGNEFGGGREFPQPDGSLVRSSNITFDEETGIGKWTENRFVDIFKTQSDQATLNNKLENGIINSPMPWTMYGGMNENDLKAIYAYLKTLKPVINKVNKFKHAAKK